MKEAIVEMEQEIGEFIGYKRTKENKYAKEIFYDGEEEVAYINSVVFQDSLDATSLAWDKMFVTIKELVNFNTREYNYEISVYTPWSGCHKLVERVQSGWLEKRTLAAAIATVKAIRLHKRVNKKAA